MRTPSPTSLHSGDSLITGPAALAHCRPDLPRELGDLRFEFPEWLVEDCDEMRGLARNDRRGAPARDEETNLAEEVTGAESRERVGAVHHVDAAVDQCIEVVSEVTVTADRRADIGTD